MNACISSLVNSLTMPVMISRMVREDPGKPNPGKIQLSVQGKK